MSRNLILLLALLCSTAYTLDAVAIPPIKSQEQQGEEAQSIEIKLNGNLLTGSAIVSGCIRCPLTLDIDEKTRFFYNGKAISRRKAQSLSGNSGTVIFEHGRTIRIRW